MIKVASYNIRKSIGTDRRRRPERTMAVLTELNADIIALQEADRRFGARAAVLSDQLTLHGTWKPVPVGLREFSMGWHGNALLVRSDADILDCEAIHLPALEPRGAVVADVRINGQRVRVVGMHLDLSGLWRRKQARAILSYLASKEESCPTILMGDLNEWSAQGGCLRDFSADFAFADTGRSFHARRPIARLDRIMASHELRFVGAGVHDSITSRMASDHLPIWATVQAA